MACTTNNQCTSSNCVDGVCCNTLCNDGCHGCALPGSAGTCTTRFTEFTAPLGAAFESIPITVGPDGNLWFLEEGVPGGPSRMGRITTAGAITEFNISTIERGAFALGADGALWYNDSTDDPSFGIFRVNTSGTQLVTLSPSPTLENGWMYFDGSGTWVMMVDLSGNNQHQIAQFNSLFQVSRTVAVDFVTTAMTRGPDANLWVGGPGSILRVNANNTTTTFPVAGVSPFNSGMTSGPDGNIWFTLPGSNQIGAMTTAGAVIHTFTLPTAASNPSRMVSGPLSSVWFMEPTATNPRLARSTTSGTITECPIVDSRQNAPGDIAVGPDGNIWFTGIATVGNAVKIYRYRP